MIRELHEPDRQAILDYAYLHERENLFIIGSLGCHGVFAENRYFGYGADSGLEGIAAYFGRWGSFVAHAQENSVLDALVDRIMGEHILFTSIPAFRRYAEPMVARLREKHGREPKRISEETVFLLEKSSFRPVEGQAIMATEADRDACVQFEVDRPGVPVTEEGRARVILEYTFIIRLDHMLVSKANVQGFSRHYAQIGGVGTLPQYRRRGLGRQCVSALCQHCFSKGVGHIILFTANTNIPAQNLYRSLGFVPVDEFLIAEYAS